MQLGRLYLTKDGRDLLAKGQDGNSLHFTRFAIGDGRIESVGQMLEMKGLVSEKGSTGFRENSIQVVGDGSAKISVLLTNDDNDKWIDMSEYGIFAQDPDRGEVLYAVGGNYEHPDPIPPSSSRLWEMEMDIIVQVGNVENINITIDRSMTYVTYEEFWDLAGKGRTFQTVKGNWDLIQDLMLQIKGYANSTVDGKEATVFKISHASIGPDEDVDGIWVPSVGGFLV